MVLARERARAERGELVDLLLLACALFLWSRDANRNCGLSWSTVQAAVTIEGIVES